MKSWNFARLVLVATLTISSQLAIVSAAVQTASSTGTLQLSSIGRGPLYFEGSIVFFRVRSGNSNWTEKSLGRSGAAPTFSLPAADYELETFVRPCDGNCGLLDPPTDRCSSKFSLAAGKTLYAVRHQTDSGMCTVTVESTAPKP